VTCGKIITVLKQTSKNVIPETEGYIIGLMVDLQHTVDLTHQYSGTSISAFKQNTVESRCEGPTSNGNALITEAYINWQYQKSA